ncbi:MAG: GNAT family N-acetyltransferase [Brachybacterium paraconglomeratum]|nr:GNAT family N-acetyltransferase [Brachybacterium paraconglomeratum]
MPVDIELVPPTLALRDEVADCFADFAGTAVDGSGITDPSRTPRTDDELSEFVARRLAEEDPATELADGWVHCTSRWIRETATGEVLGFLAVRHQLTPFLLEVGGHIGYSVRPGARRRGVATAALAQGLEIAAGLGIDPVLVTCDTDNTASRRTIEGAGGTLEDIRDGKRRYWIGEGERPVQR